MKKKKIVIFEQELRFNLAASKLPQHKAGKW